jgi:hypothetical protein
MNQSHSNFRSRVQRIESARRHRVGKAIVFPSNGLMPPRQRHLRFGFPFKGLVMAFAISVAVKAYLIWVIGLESYNAEVVALLNGTSVQQAAARILMPDQLTMWVADQFEAVATRLTVWYASL